MRGRSTHRSRKTTRKEGSQSEKNCRVCTIVQGPPEQPLEDALCKNNQFIAVFISIGHNSKIKHTGGP
jgi:hypothetical protein